MPISAESLRSKKGANVKIYDHAYFWRKTLFLCIGSNNMADARTRGGRDASDNLGR